MDPAHHPRPGHLINRAAKLLLRLGEPRFQALGLATAQLPVLAALDEGNSMTQTQLAELARIEQPTMAQLLTRMDRDGLIRRTPDPADGRSTLITLTPKAIRRLEPAHQIIIDANQQALRGFSPAETDTLVHLLKRVVDNLESPPENEKAAPAGAAKRRG